MKSSIYVQSHFPMAALRGTHRILATAALTAREQPRTLLRFLAPESVSATLAEAPQKFRLLRKSYHWWSARVTRINATSILPLSDNRVYGFPLRFEESQTLNVVITGNCLRGYWYRHFGPGQAMQKRPCPSNPKVSAPKQRPKHKQTPNPKHPAPLRV